MSIGPVFEGVSSFLAFLLHDHHRRRPNGSQAEAFAVPISLPTQMLSNMTVKCFYGRDTNEACAHSSQRAKVQHGHAHRFRDTVVTHFEDEREREDSR